MAEQFGIIREIRDGNPHLSIYVAAKWLTDNFRECEELISNTFSTP
jgi:hypothetical protein